MHQYYGEHCAFFLIRVSGDWNEAQELIKEVLDDHSVTAYGVYPLFGHYDVLVRLWASPDLRDRVAKNLLTNTALIDQLNEFNVRDIKYDWWDIDPQGSVVDHRDKIGAVAKAESRGKDVEEMSEFQDLRKEGFIAKSREFDDGSVKIYILVIPTHRKSSMSNRSLSNFFIEQNNVEFEDLDDVSLYSGLGFADLIVKGVAPSYDAIFPIVENLNGQLKAHHIKTTTLVVSSPRCFESEVILAERAQIGEDLEDLVAYIGDGTISEAVRKLDSERKASLEKLYQRGAGRYKAGPFSEYFASLLRYSISAATEDLVGLLGFVPKLEFLLRDFLIHTFAEVLGKNWYSKVKELMIESSGGELEAPGAPSMLALAQLLRSYSALRKSEPELERFTEVHLGPGWERAMMQFAPLRNEFAHGTVYEPSYSVEKYDDFNDLIFSVGDVFKNLEKYQKHKKNK